ncbi:hypothetical protein EDD37DRAFT_160953 [Exophiala viscosa]|uniref:uncharacterized protein n=1 Tax=Exophiala viscosa TaxID=2486360 RepID=UPI0021A13C6C|nr:hypothetical protein EDD37DRAFT_160953 [Exophiala viscosa]
MQPASNLPGKGTGHSLGCKAKTSAGAHRQSRPRTYTLHPSMVPLSRLLTRYHQLAAIVQLPKPTSFLSNLSILAAITTTTTPSAIDTTPDSFDLFLLLPSPLLPYLFVVVVAVVVTFPHPQNQRLRPSQPPPISKAHPRLSHSFREPFACLELFLLFVDSP